MSPADPPVPTWLSGYRYIETDVSSLTAFAATLEKELANFTQTWNRVVAPRLDRVHFGSSPYTAHTDELRRAREYYRKCLGDVRPLAANIVTGTNRLADAARAIARDYARSDEFARIRMADVLRVMPDPRSTGAAPPPLPRNKPGI